MIVAIGAALVAALFATGCLLLMHGFPRSKADRQARKAGGRQGRAKEVNLDSIPPNTARIMTPGASPSSQSFA